MLNQNLKLTVLDEKLAVLKLPPAEPVPSWAWPGEFVSISRTPEELSIVCSEGNIPEGIDNSGDWRVLKFDGILDFSLTGILAGIAGRLAEAGISIFAVSTFNTDYILVRDKDLLGAIVVLEKAHYQITK